MMEFSKLKMATYKVAKWKFFTNHALDAMYF